MTLTLLLDLDDTLLDTNMTEFVPAYLQALAKHLGGAAQRDVMLRALMSGTQQMLVNEDPGVTLEEVFDRAFYPKLGVEKNALREAIDDFYANTFRQLSQITRRRPAAKELVDWAIERGYRLVIATDPLLPMVAIRERILWAGLAPEQFELISSYETFHFTKSHPAYFAEVLGRLGWPGGPVLMVGNDEERDLMPAAELGLMTYRIAMQETDRIPAGAKGAGGTLQDLCRWLDLIDPGTLEPKFQSQRAITSILLSTPAVLDGLVSKLTPEQWQHEPSPEDWALIEIVSHLRDTEREVHHDQVRKLLDEPQPFVPRPDAAVWAKQRKYLAEDGPGASVGFREARMETLKMLGGPPPDVWAKAARHAIFGPTDFLEVVGFIADHDRLHVQQAWRTLQALP